ncbi:MAG: M20/M25/M40 family metallo-hydrolase [Acidobacteriota bacterium]
MRFRFWYLIAALLLTGCSTASTPSPQAAPAPKPSAEQMRLVTELQSSPEVIATGAWIDEHREQILGDWRTLTEIPAPSGKEERRAAWIEQFLGHSGLDVHRDSAGNVIAVRKGTGGGSSTVFDAHLDTVFAESTELKTSIRDGRIYAPGVGDDTRNVIALLASIQALNDSKINTAGDLIFVFTTREETDFGGVKQFLTDYRGKIDRYVALDGGFEGLTYAGIGIYWYRYHILGPGGHTRSSTPPWSAAFPLARAINRIYELRLPTDPEAYANIGMLGGSDVVNGKASDAWFSLDLRSTNAADLDRLDGEIRSIVEKEAARVGMTMRQETISRDQVAQIPGNRLSPTVMISEAVFRATGVVDPSVTDTASNHSSEALRAGIPAISTGAAPCRGSHSLHESCEIEPLYAGIKRIVLLELALTAP